MALRRSLLQKKKLLVKRFLGFHKKIAREPFRASLPRAGIRAYSTGDAIVVNADEAATVALYTMNGMLVANEQVAAGTTTLNNLNAGLYILRITNAEGQTDVVKALIK